MERYTVWENGQARVEQTCLPQALERLARFEDLFFGLEEEQRGISLQLEELRAQGKEKTVKFRELLAQKLANQTVKMTLERYKIK